MQTAHEASFGKCKDLIKELFLEINVDNLGLPTLAAFDLSMVSFTTATSIAEELSSQANHAFET